MQPPPKSQQQQAPNNRQVRLRTHYELRCDDCKTADYLVEEGGSTICTECGLVASPYVIDMGQEWHNYDDDGGDDKSRVGNVSDPFFANDLSTDISGSRNAGHLIRGHMKTHAKNEAERNLREGFSKIETFTRSLDILNRDSLHAKNLYKIMYDLKPIKSSKEMIGYAIAALYAACKIGGAARNLKEFMIVSGLDRKAIGKYYKKIEAESKRVSENDPNKSMIELGYQSNTPAQMIPRLADSLGLEFKVRAAAERVANRAVEFGITSGKSPTTVAAAAIFMCSELHTTKTPIADIANAAGITESTIRKCLKDLKENKARLLPGDKL